MWNPFVEPDARPALTLEPDSKDATRPDAFEAPPAGDIPPTGRTRPAHEAPGVAEAIGDVRAAFMRMLRAHLALLKAELAIAGRELGIIVGLAVGALFVAILVAILLYVGAFLFMGEWLFGSMGWGIIHGTLLGLAIIGFVAIDLAGGSVRSYGWGALVGVIVTVVLSALLLSNVGNETAEWGSRLVQDQVPAGDLPFGQEWLTTLVGLVIGAAIMAIVALILGWRAHLRGGELSATVVAGSLAGALVGAIYASTRYDAPDGVLGLAIMVGLISWMIVGILLAYRRGFDVETRYASLVPRESIVAFEKSRDFLKEQLARQKDRMSG